MMNKARPKVLIVGAGFAGVEALARLGKYFGKNIDLTLINPTNYFLFTPLLHEVATGGLFPENVVTPLRRVVRAAGTKLLVGAVKSVDLERKIVSTNIGKLEYDYLVVAPGSTTNFYDTPGAAENSFTLKDVNDAIKLKNHLINCFELVLAGLADRNEALTFVVVGGGATGVELVAEIADFFNDAFRGFYPESLILSVKIILVQKDNHILPQFSELLRTKCLNKLADKGIEVRLNEGVAEVLPHGVKLSSDEIISSKTVVWTAGVKPQEIDFKPAPAMIRGRVIVDEFLRLTDRPEVFVLGDAAFVKAKNNEPLPMLAQVAHQAAKTAANNVRRAITGHLPVAFNYRHRGTLISLGSWFAVGEIGPFHFSGRIIWWLWRMVYLFKMPTFSKKLQIALDWTIDLFTPRDISILPCQNNRKKT